MMESIKIPLVVALLLVFAASPVSCFVAPRSRRGSVSSRPLSLKPVDDQKLFAKSEEEVGPDIQKNFEDFGPFLIGDLRDDKLIQTAIDDAVGQQDEAEKMGIWAARGILLFVAVLWATNFASVKYLETLCFHPPCNHPPSEAALARFGVAAMVSVPLLIGQRRDVILAGFECGLWVALGYVTQAMALSSIPAGTCAFICSLTVVVVPLIAAFFGMPIKPINLASAVVALTGVGVLEGLIDVHAIMGAQPALAVDTSLAVIHSAATSSTVTEASGPIGNLAEMIGVTKGDILALGQPIGFGVSFMRIEHYVEKFKNVKNRVLTITAAECVVVGLVSLLWVLYDFHGTIPNFGYMLDWHRLVAIAWTGIMTTIVAIYFEGFALQTASATEAALIFSSEPVWASIFGAWLLRERLGISSYIGGAIILVACLMGALGDLSLFSLKQKGEKETESSP